MAVNPSDPSQLRGATVTGSQGVMLGRVDDVYLDEKNGEAVWVAVETGTVGGHLVLVPLAAADHRDGTLRVPYTADQVRDAPRYDPGARISAQDERQLLSHFDVPYAGGTTIEKPAADTATDDTMIRSEEELRVSTRTVATGRVRLRKHIVTEMQTITVPVSREELTVEREEIADADPGEVPSSPSLSSEEREIILYAERPVVTTRIVAVERVRIDTRTVHEQQQVSGQVRKEQIDLEESDPAEQHRG